MNNEQQQQPSGEEHRLASHWSLYFFQSLDEKLEKINENTSE